MKHVLALIVVLLLPVAALAQSGSSYADNCKAWLALVDAGRYDESWDTASAIVKSKFTKEQWAGAVKAARDTVGLPLSRGGAQVAQSDILPGLPFGHYLVLTLRTKFQMNPNATETIIMKQENGDWKVVGYFIK